MNDYRQIELLAPAGDWACVKAAVTAGADAVYFGLERFNARLRAENFAVSDLSEVMGYLHGHGVRGFVTMNTLVFTGELGDAAAYVVELARAGVDAVIVQDIGLALLVRAVAPGVGLHASTQMTVTSPEGLEWVQRTVGLDRAVLARELSVREIGRFAKVGGAPPVEVFVHGALCVAYSGQCLTSESLGQRSANRGECAQACRMPYEVVVDGETRDLGDRRHLLSPQDLAAVDLVPDLIDAGVASFKIEGRLKSPEYVTAVTGVYRKAIDSALATRGSGGAGSGTVGGGGPGRGDRPAAVTDRDRYELEMTFSRGLSTGWLGGTDHPRLTHGRFGKKRGPFVGEVVAVEGERVTVTKPACPLAPGDGIVFDTGGDTNAEQGGMLFGVRGGDLVLDRRSGVDPSRVPVGARVWKTSDPALEKELRRRAKARPAVRPGRKEPLRLEVSGRPGGPLVLRVEGRGVELESASPLEPARTAPLGDELLTRQLGKLGGTPFELGSVANRIEGEVSLPVRELNDLRRRAVAVLTGRPSGASPSAALASLLPESPTAPTGGLASAGGLDLEVLVRTSDQLDAALAAGTGTLYLDFEDIRRYRDAVARCRAPGRPRPVGLSEPPPVRVFLATPRIQKSGEAGFFRLVERAAPDGVLVRNLGGIDHFAGRHDLVAVGDFSLNVANPITARHLIDHGLARVTVSYDLDIGQTIDLLSSAPPEWFLLTIHQHMPMFHMEHCVFCTFLSDGHDASDCGRPCEKHRVQLRDRVGQLHRLHADVGCRNTLFRGQAQSAARYFNALAATGLRRFRLDLLDESAPATGHLIETYRGLLAGTATGDDVHRQLDAESRLGVVEGTLRRPSATPA